MASGDYDAYAKERDTKISHMIHFRFCHDTYIFKPKEVLKENGDPYLVFTPFYKKARAVLSGKNIETKKIAEHILVQDDYEGIQIKGKKVPLKLDNFLKKIDAYQEKQDYLFSDATSNLSVDLRFGTISIRAVLRALFSLRGADIEPFVRQLIFRDFYACLLFYIPLLQNQNYKCSFNGIEDEEKFRAFREARTGVPIVDAGMRELLKTGIMHNRARMICASFFTKDLLLPWQWSAGTGVDPQPYFRVFNPYLQSKKFDKETIYIKKWLPELLHVEPKNIHDEQFLQNATIKNYPRPVIVHKEAKERALNYYKKSAVLK